MSVYFSFGSIEPPNREWRADERSNGLPHIYQEPR
jgi:hypothetical protein